MTINIDVTMHSDGKIRCDVEKGDRYVVAKLSERPSMFAVTGGIKLFLMTDAEIAAFKALAKALAAQDVPAEDVV